MELADGIHHPLLLVLPQFGFEVELFTSQQDRNAVIADRPGKQDLASNPN
jgi:hypothetical protein